MKTTVAGCYFVNNFTQSKAYFTVFSISLPLNKYPLWFLSRFTLSLEFRSRYHQLLHKIEFFSGIWHLAKKDFWKHQENSSFTGSSILSVSGILKRTFVFIVCFILRPQSKSILPIIFLLLLLFLFYLSLLLFTLAIESKENREGKIVFGTSLPMTSYGVNWGYYRW